MEIIERIVGKFWYKGSDKNIEIENTDEIIDDEEFHDAKDSVNDIFTNNDRGEETTATSNSGMNDNENNYIRNDDKIMEEEQFFDAIESLDDTITYDTIAEGKKFYKIATSSNIIKDDENNEYHTFYEHLENVFSYYLRNRDEEETHNQTTTSNNRINNGENNEVKNVDEITEEEEFFDATESLDDTVTSDNIAEGEDFHKIVTSSNVIKDGENNEYHTFYEVLENIFSHYLRNSGEEETYNKTTTSNENNEFHAFYEHLENIFSHYIRPAKEMDRTKPIDHLPPSLNFPIEYSMGINVPEIPAKRLSPMKSSSSQSKIDHTTKAAITNLSKVKKCCKHCKKCGRVLEPQMRKKVTFNKFITEIHNIPETSVKSLVPMRSPLHMDIDNHNKPANKDTDGPEIFEKALSRVRYTSERKVRFTIKPSCSHMREDSDLEQPQFPATLPKKPTKIKKVKRSFSKLCAKLSLLKNHKQIYSDSSVKYKMLGEEKEK